MSTFYVCTHCQLLALTTRVQARFSLLMEVTTPSSCFTPNRFTPFYFNTPCQFTPFLNLCSLIFGLTPFGWLCSITLIAYF